MHKTPSRGDPIPLRYLSRRLAVEAGMLELSCMTPSIDNGSIQRRLYEGISSVLVAMLRAHLDDLYPIVPSACQNSNFRNSRPSCSTSMLL